MSDPFLSLPGTKRKRPSRPSKHTISEKSRSGIPTKRRLRDTSPQSDTDDDIGPGAIESDIEVDIEESEESDNEETATSKRLRLAKEYLEKVRVEEGYLYLMILLMVGMEFDAGEIDRDIIAQRLKEDVAETKGRIFKFIASSLRLHSFGKWIQHKNPVTCVCVYGQYVYTGCKNGVIEKWDISHIQKPTRITHINREKNTKVFTGHFDDILCMAISGEGKFLATGGSDKRICIWQTSTMTHLKTFTQHRGPVMVHFICARLTLGSQLSFVEQPTLLNKFRSNVKVMVIK
jgi:ribosomal RNA-processing protein 9